MKKGTTKIEKRKVRRGRKERRKRKERKTEKVMHYRGSLNKCTGDKIVAA